MRHGWAASAMAGLMLLLTACGGEDIVDGPFIADWRLDEQPCVEPTDGSLCYELVLGVSGHDGERAASCRIYPLDTDGSAYSLDSALAADLDAETSEHDVVVLEGFSIRAGDTPVFEVALPVVDDEGFWRWQVTCEPGAPG